MHRPIRVTLLPLISVSSARAGQAPQKTILEAGVNSPSHFKIKVASNSDSCYNIKIRERKETWLVSSKNEVKYFLLNTEKFVIIFVQNQKGVGFTVTGAKKLHPRAGKKLESSTSNPLARR